MKITQQELIEFADEQGLKIFGNSKVVMSKIRTLHRLINRGLIPKATWEGGTSAGYWENDTEIKDRVIWLDEQKKKGKSYRRMKEDLEPEKSYSQEEMIIKNIIEKIDKLSKISPDVNGFEFLKADMLDVLGRWEEALSILKTLEKTCGENKELLTYVYDEMAYVYQTLGVKEKALAACNKRIEIAKAMEDNNEIGLAYCATGSNLCLFGDTEKAYDYYKKAILLLEGTEEIGNAYAGIHWVLVQQGNLSEAEIYLKKSIKIFEKTGNDRKKSICLSNLGMLYLDMNELSKALKLMKEAYYTMSRLHDLYEMAATSSNIGRVYMKKGSFSMAMEHFRHAYQLASQAKNQSEMARYLEFMSEVYKKMGNDKKSEFYLKESKRIKENILDNEKNNEVDVSVSDD